MEKMEREYKKNRRKQGQMRGKVCRQLLQCIMAQYNTTQKALGFQSEVFMQ